MFTLKALQELAALDVGLDKDDACDVLASLSVRNFHGRTRSTTTGEWLHVFKPKVGSLLIYVKVILRANCIVVSFHEDNHETDLS